MKEFIDKLIERLEEEQKEAQRDGSLSFAMGFKSAKLIVNHLAEEYKGGWIPCSGCEDCQHKECEHHGKV